MNTKIIIFATVALCLGVALGYFFGYDIGFEKAVGHIPRVESFEECLQAGNPVMETYPRQCRANGDVFVEDIGNELEKLDLIRVENPRPNQVISSPLEITGEARGTWFFEASFAVYLYDALGGELATAPAEAQSEWMTEEFVPFSANLIFDEPSSEKGELVLEKANPSGLPATEDELRIPVRFR